MKQRLKPIDISIVSEYMGRFQTAIVALLVIGITTHAFLTRHQARGHVTLLLSVPDDAERFEPLARIVARHTSRSVEIGVDEWTGAAELLVMSPMEYFARRDTLGLAPLFGIVSSPGDRALIIGGRGGTRSPERATDVLFSQPRSVNGCWVQLIALARRRADIPATLDSLRFAPGAGGRGVAWAVQQGLADYGACRASDLDGLQENGAVTVIFQTPALPDMILAVREQDMHYFLERLGGIAAAFDAPSDEDRDAVELLKARGIGGIRVISETQLAELETVFEFIVEMSGGAQTGRAGGDGVAEAGNP